MADDVSAEGPEKPENESWKKVARGALQVAGAVPFAGGLFSAAAGYWSEREQDRLNDFLKQWIAMLEDELREKQTTIAEIAMRLDLHDEEIAERVTSDDYQALVKRHSEIGPEQRAQPSKNTFGTYSLTRRQRANL